MSDTSSRDPARDTMLASAMSSERMEGDESLWTRRLPTKLELRKLAPAGLLFGVSYICLFEAYWRGRVTVV